MSVGSHHVQGVAVDNRHCYACHWEATATGGVDPRFHEGKTSSSGKVDLVIWGEGLRPTVHREGSTAVGFRPAAIGTPEERTEIGGITSHCLSCHSERNNELTPFAGDDQTPRRYAWDRKSIADRYSQKGVTTWGKYSTATSNKKQQVNKAFSAHGNAGANEGGWSPVSGYDGSIPVTRGGSAARNVECFDCHNAHGSRVPGITSSYLTAAGTRNGAILKETIAGRGGYRTTYTPSMNTDNHSSNPYNAGAGICFDCHETATVGTTPWGYRETFGAGEPIIGYKDTSRFGPGEKGSTARFTSRRKRTDIASSHLKAGKMLNFSTSERLYGLCTPCHDPHGISPTLGETMSYAVPLLKGSWLTSPYLDDGPPTKAISARPGQGSGLNGSANAAATSGTGSPREPISRAGVKYNIDRNTFNNNGHIGEDADTFGGLCLRCHPAAALRGDSRASRIHRAVKGWGKNKEHAFPCSKCHQAHNSGLPRLMQTNCFEVGPAGLRENSGLPWIPEQLDTAKSKQSSIKDDSGSTSKTAGKVAVVGCHVKQFGKGSSGSGKKNGDQWNRKNTW